MQAKERIHPQEIFRRREEFGISDSIEKLADIIDFDRNSIRRKEAVKFLGLFRDNSCFEIFENLLISDDSMAIKSEAARALGRLKLKKGLKPLKWILEMAHDDNIFFKMVILRAIASIRFEDPEIKLFINHLNCRDKAIKTCIKNRLINLGPAKLLNFLLESLKEEGVSEKYEKTLLKLIGYELSEINLSSKDSNFVRNEYPEVLLILLENKDFLIELLASVFEEDDYQLNRSTQIILELLGDEVYSILINFLNSEELVIKKNAIILIGKLKVKNAVNLLIHNLESIYEEIVIASIQALGEIGDLSTVPKLLIILDLEATKFDDVDFNLKWYILEAVKKIYNNNRNAPFDSLYYSLNFGNKILTESVVTIMGEIMDREFLDPLLILLNEPDSEICKNSIIALGKIGCKEAIDPLLTLLCEETTYWLHKKVIIDSLNSIFRKHRHIIFNKEHKLHGFFMMRVERIIEYLNNYNEENHKVKLSIINFLEKYGGRTALKVLLSQVNDFHRIVRITASNAIKEIESRLNSD